MTTKSTSVRYSMPSGAWVEILDINTLSRQERREIRILAAEASAAAPKDDSPRKFLEAQEGLDEEIIYPRMITAWSYKASLPPTAEILDEVFGPRAADEMALKGIATEWFRAFYPDFSPKIVENGKGKVLDPNALISP